MTKGPLAFGESQIGFSDLDPVDAAATVTWFLNQGTEVLVAV